MKLVFKNIVKSIASVCLILNIIAAMYLGIYYFSALKKVENNNNEIVQSLIEVGKNTREDIKSKSEEDGNKNIGIVVTLVPFYVRFESMTTILLASILIGSIIGIAKSIDETSRKKVIVTYILTYLVLLAIIGLYEILTYGEINFENLFGIAMATLAIYTVVYGITIFKKRIDNNRKVKLMNKDLNENKL